MNFIGMQHDGKIFVGTALPVSLPSHGNMLQQRGYQHGKIPVTHDRPRTPAIQEAVEKASKLPLRRRKAALNIHQQGFERQVAAGEWSKKAFFNSLPGKSEGNPRSTGSAAALDKHPRAGEYSSQPIPEALR